MYIEKVILKNIRCFEALTLSFDLRGATPPWTVLVGDNATGKTTLLRSIALGLCDESSAAGLMRESDEGYIRRGKKGEDASITIRLRSRSNPQERYAVTTTITKVAGQERVRQTTFPRKDFPWDELFVCAYGAARGTSGTGDIAGWSPINAVYNLFNYAEGLQNAELTILRLKTRVAKNAALHRVGDILLQDKKAIQLQPSGITMNGPWGRDMPLRDLADGYRCSFQWITDMLGWAFAKWPELKNLNELDGVVLVDELEQHLHATLQRNFIHRLRRAFPKLQFLATTHSPLIASAIGPISEKHPRVGTEDEARDRLVYLELQEGNVVTREYLPSLRLRRVDQVLASRAFKYFIDEDPSVERVLREASILAGKKRRTEKQEHRYQRLCRALEPILLPAGQTLVEREIESRRYSEVVRELRKVEKELRGD